MIKIDNEEFGKIVADAIDAIPPHYLERIDNVAFLLEDEPTIAQRKQLGLRCSDLLLGLYEGVPLPARNGTTKILPDKITIFKEPLEVVSTDLNDAKARIKRTIWHEVAHYYGLDHEAIHALERKHMRDLSQHKNNK